MALSQFARVAVVTDGERGSNIAVAADSAALPMHVHVDATAARLVDACGAGDTYAAGVMYAWHLLEKYPMGVAEWRVAGQFASRLAGMVVA